MHCETLDQIHTSTPTHNPQKQSHGFPGQDTTSPTATNPTSGDSASPPSPLPPAVRTPNSTESELLNLDPPYLVPRPLAFPTPTLLVEVLAAHNLKVRSGCLGDVSVCSVCVCVCVCV